MWKWSKGKTYFNAELGNEKIHVLQALLHVCSVCDGILKDNVYMLDGHYFCEKDFKVSSIADMSSVQMMIYNPNDPGTLQYRDLQHLCQANLSWHFSLSGRCEVPPSLSCMWGLSQEYGGETDHTGWQEQGLLHSGLWKVI